MLKVAKKNDLDVWWFQENAAHKIAHEYVIKIT